MGTETPSLASRATFYDSAYVAGNTGILLNGRLKAFDLKSNSPNSLEPGKRPVTTLNTWMVTDEQGKLEYLGAPRCARSGPDEPASVV